MVSRDSVRSVLLELANDDDFVNMVWQFLGKASAEFQLVPLLLSIGLRSYKVIEDIITCHHLSSYRDHQRDENVMITEHLHHLPSPILHGFPHHRRHLHIPSLSFSVHFAKPRGWLSCFKQSLGKA